MTIEFHCEHCGKLLKTPDDKAGKRGKCPECLEPIVVPDAETSSETEFDADFRAAPQRSSSFAATRDPEPTKPCPMCGVEVSVSARTCSACGENLRTKTEHRFSAGQQIDVGEVISDAWGRFNQQMGISIGAVLFVGIIGGILGQISDQLSEEEQAFGFIVTIVILMFQIWLSLGMNRLLLNVARGEQAEFTQLFSGGPYWGRAILATLLIGLMIFGIVVVGVFIVGLGAVAGGVLAFPLLILVIVAAIGVSMGFYWYQFILIDIDPPGISCLALSREIMSGNYLSVILIMVCSFLLILAGLLMFVVGLILTVPFVAVLWATTYNHISGGRDHTTSGY